MSKGLFISFEGPDGSGKTTQIKRLADYLQSKGYEVVLTREPGGTAISEKIRSLLLDPENKEMDSLTEAFLYAAGRAQHVAQLIKPSLQEGKIVLCDRFMDSSIAYQGYARGLGDCVRQINEIAVDDCQPDITFFMNLSAESGMARVNSRLTGNEKPDRLEQEAIDFHKKVYEGYIQLSKIYTDRYIIVDADRSIEEITKELINIIDARVSK